MYSTHCMALLEIGTQIEGYQVQGPLGQGGMGVVYAGIQPLIGKEVAIKVLSPDAAANQINSERFIKEAQAVNRIRHPGIVDIFAAGVLADGSPYLIMERLHGMSLDQYLRQQGRLSIEASLEIFMAILEPLAAAHEKGIVHRDIKPANLFLLENFLERKNQSGPLLKILDFGIAKLQAGEDSAGQVSLTRTGQIIGTPLYMAPEQIGGESFDVRADLYALGVILYRMLAGRLPYEDSVLGALIKR